MKKEFKQIEFFCKKCEKTMKMDYVITGDDNAPVLPGMILRCHTRKCTRVMIMKKYTEGMVVAQVNNEGKVFI